MLERWEHHHSKFRLIQTFSLSYSYQHLDPYIFIDGKLYHSTPNLIIYPAMGELLLIQEYLLDF